MKMLITTKYKVPVPPILLTKLGAAISKPFTKPPCAAPLKTYK